MAPDLDASTEAATRNPSDTPDGQSQPVSTRIKVTAASVLGGDKIQLPAQLATWVTAGLSIGLSVWGMVIFAHDVVQMPLKVAYFAAGFLEMALLACALWDRVSAARGRATNSIATWVFSLLSGTFASLHEFASRDATGAWVWHSDPGAILAGSWRFAIPLIAAFMLHKAVIGIRDAAVGITVTEARRNKRLHKVARLAHRLQQLTKQIREYKTDKRGTLVIELRRTQAKKRFWRAYDGLLNAYPATEAQLKHDLDVWTRIVAIADELPGMTEVAPEGGLTTVAALMNVKTPARKKTNTPKPRPAAPAAEASAPAAPREVASPPPASNVRQLKASDDVPDAAKEAKALFDQMVAADPFTKPMASLIQSELGIDKDPATVRRWVGKWWKEHESTLPSVTGPGTLDELVASATPSEQEQAAQEA